MKPFLLTAFIFSGILNGSAIEYTPQTAQMNPAAAEVLVLNGGPGDASWLIQNASSLISLQEVIISGVTDEQTALNLVTSVAACNTVRSIRFRNCTLQSLPANLRMLTKVEAFTSENSIVADGEQFYNAIADMCGVHRVTVIGTEFRTLPNSFSRLRVMDNIRIINNDIQLASGYDRNNKTPDELRATDSVLFGFGDDALIFSYTCYNAMAAKAHVQMFRDVLQGAFCSSNTFYSPVAAQAFVKPHPLVKAPVNGLDIYPNVYSVNSLTGSVLEYGSGTRIIVPALAFEDADGNPVSGNVDITYREFRDQVDIVLSGIPMKYDSAGSVGDFQSAGMFEMESSQNGKEVFLREGKEVSLKFAVTDTASDYNFYRLDEQNGWTYLGNTGKVESDKAEVPDAPTTRIPGTEDNGVLNGYATQTDAGQPATIAARLYQNAVDNIFVRNWIRDTTDFDSRYSDTCYYGMNRCIDGSSAASSGAKSKMSSRIYLEHRISGNDYTVVSVHNSAGRWGYNYELGAYGAYNWMINEKMTSRQVDHRFGADAGINDCRVLEEGGEYYFELKYYWGFDRIKVVPVRLNADNQPVVADEEQQEKLFNSYTKKLNSRRNRVNRDNAGQVWRQQRNVIRARNDSMNAWGGLKKVMTAEEKCMDFVSWNAYVQHSTTSERKYLIAGLFLKTSVKFQLITIPRMGYHNCDRVVKMTNPVVFVAKKIVVAGSVIVPAIIHVLNDKFRGSVFSFSKGGLGNGVRATYEAQGGNHLLITDAEGNLYEVSVEEFNRGTEANKQEPEFEATLLPADGATAATVRRAENL